MIKAVLFDLDGTLSDSLASMALAGNTVLEQFGLPKMPVENYRYYCGDGAAMLVKRALSDAGDKELQYFDEAYEAYQEVFRKDCTFHVKPYNGIPEMVARLQEQGIKIAVVSNKPHDRTLDVVNKLFGLDAFDAVIGMKEGRNGKPDPAGALEAAQLLGVEPSECAFVGDTNVDMRTGTNAGMIRVGVLWGFRDKKELVENGADEIVERPEELLEVIEKYS